MPKIPANRGRPSAETIFYQRRRDMDTPSDFKCRYCGRIFPRKKSLITHEMTHTGEKPHKCDYPNCNAEFTQSGQLKNHLRIHSGETPYVCPVNGCGQRYKHSNRKCPRHKTEKLVTDGKEDIRTDFENLSDEEIEWIQRYREKKLSESNRQKSFSGSDQSSPGDNELIEEETDVEETDEEETDEEETDEEETEEETDEEETDEEETDEEETDEEETNRVRMSVAREYSEKEMEVAFILAGLEETIIRRAELS